MQPFPIVAENPITSGYLSKYKGAAFDGCYFYVTLLNCCKILKYNRQFEPDGYFDTKRAYTCVCYDEGENCFWAADGCRGTLYKLDCHFQEIACMDIHDCDDYGAVVVGISYDCADDTLVVAFANTLVKIQKDQKKIIGVIKKSCKEWYTGILSIAPYLLTIDTCSSSQRICLCTWEGAVIKEFSAPQGFVIETIIFSPWHHHEEESPYSFVLLGTKHGCWAYFLEGILSCELFENGIHACNFELCNKRCKPDPEPSCHCDDMIESIALMEASLAHILNAEGEKIQKILEIAENAEDIDAILEVNKSVQQTLVNVTHLEIILYDKLVALDKCGQDPCEEFDEWGCNECCKELCQSNCSHMSICAAK
ncbi:MAG: hypothetical protein RR131_06070 [Anaerovorax sp.]